MVTAFKQASGKTVSYQIVNKRDGDIAICYADPIEVIRDLGWSSKKTIEGMIKDT